MAAVWSVAWPISTEYPEECRYNTLLQISIGQEEVDEVITRDIHRTFPEHPQFGFAQGQQALFRVLKAYSLHDLEVGDLLSITLELLLYKVCTSGSPSMVALHLLGSQGLRM